jgi:hypothetical protein
VSAYTFRDWLKKEAPNYPDIDIALSPSVQNAAERVGYEPVSAVALVRAIFDLHNEYAGGAAESLRLTNTPTMRVAYEWIYEVLTLFDPAQSFGAHEPTLHGRLLVIGLCLLEPKLREQMEAAGAFTALLKELWEPFPDILTERGRALYEPPVESKQPPDLLDSVPTWPDDPLLNPKDDLLGRRAFARFLGRRIAAIPDKSGAYSIHIYGPWGAGKSTLLNFLRKELEGQTVDGKKWLVVEFNAWRQQQIQPPWWSLMDRIYRTTRMRLNVWERLQEFWWRIFTGRLQYVIGLIVLAWLLAFVVFPLLRSQASTSDLRDFGKVAEGLSKVLALVATIWGAIMAANRSLVFGASRAAQTYTELTHDPTNKIKDRFNGLIKKLSPERVAILIDDLDRCQSRYVVELLEGIQTLFREAPVVFVVAADRQWLNACYEEVYEKLESRIHEPGKPLGTLFLEKAFRFSTPMPGIPEELKQSYWRHLLRLAPEEKVGDLAAARKAAKDELTKAKTESAVRQLVAANRERSFPEQRALREEAVVRLASPEILERLEHTLKPYAPLLDPNPRAMKLLVNGYSANRALAILSEVEIELHQLALWTILCSRWPQLADGLAQRPELLKNIGQQPDAAVPDSLKPLWQEASVVAVVTGDSTGGKLTIETLKECARMRS